MPVGGLRISSRWFDGATARDAANWIIEATHQVDVPWGEIYGLRPFTGFSGSMQDVDPWPHWDPETERLDRIARLARNPADHARQPNQPLVVRPDEYVEAHRVELGVGVDADGCRGADAAGVHRSSNAER
jgi:hypothetical protein